MSLRLALASAYLPSVLRRRGLAELAARTARACGTTPPDLAGLTADAALHRFATFTREQSEVASASPERAAQTRRRLRSEMRAFGGRLRRRLGVRSRAEAFRAARVLYRAIGIDLQGSASGAILVRSCAFASTYRPDTCAFMGAMDEGLLAGLAGEGRLEFSQRITEGAARCAASYTFTFEPSAR
ncbi:MAG TPA: hypothetical protein VEH62_02825 [Gemmatimonadales bacterium]|nr:hypothetical protein [Gemmatimonadales bacterium]